jgi:peptide chain release factor subunit 1
MKQMTLQTDPIADLRSPSGCLLSVYVDRPSPGGFAALLTDLIRPIKERSENLGRAINKSVQGDGEKIRALAPELEADNAPAYALFASSIDDVFVRQPLTHPTASVATLGPRPYMRPLRAAPRALRSGIIVADRGLARTFVGFAGNVDELGGPLEAEIGKSNFGGFSGYAEHRVRSRADEESARIWKETAARLLESHQERPFDYLAIGSHEEHVEEISKSLHPYLTRLPRTSFASSPQHLSSGRLRSEILTLDQEIRHNRHEALAGRVLDTAWSGGNGVLGLASVLDATNAQAVDTLVVAGSFTREGTICNECGHLARNGNSCPVCGSGMFEVDDVVAAAMDATVAAGGRAYQIGVASPLDVEGVGALTRFSLVR